MKEQFTQSLNKMLEEKNYLGAYLLIKAYGGEEILKLEYTGKLVQLIIEDLAKAGRIKNREMMSYLRSMLIMIFEDVPSLARIYRQQLRQDNPSPNLFDVLNPFKDMPQNKDDFGENFKDAVDGIKKNIEDNADDNVKDFFKLAEKGINDGFNQFTDFVNNVSKSFEKGMKGEDSEEKGSEEGETSQKVEINKEEKEKAEDIEVVEGKVQDGSEASSETKKDKTETD